MKALRALALMSVLGPAGSGQASPYSDINDVAARGSIGVHSIRGGVAMLEGSGGNIAVLTGPDGILMVDAGISLSRAKIQAALHAMHSGTVRMVVVTHWHWDHSDGVSWLRREGASVMADSAAVRRLQQTIRIPEWEHTFTPVARASLPTVAITGTRRVHFNKEAVIIRRYPRSHTDNDLSVYFSKADVLVTGDTFWNGVYPFIGDPTGAGIDGAIRAADINIKLAGSRTLIIPGHGPAGKRADLIAFRNMLVDVRSKIALLKHRGFSLAKVLAARPTAQYDSKWGRSVISGQLFTALVYRGVPR